MKRCTPLARTCRATFVALALLAGTATAPSALAQYASFQRVFPPQTQRGELTVLSVYEVELNDRIEKLAPGTRIRDTSNRIVMSGQVLGREVVVNYTRQPSGVLQDVWILTPDEAAQALPKAPQQ